MKEQVLQDVDLYLKAVSAEAIAFHYKDETDSLYWLRENALSWLKENIKTHWDKVVQRAIFRALEIILEDDQNEQAFLLQCFLDNPILRPEELQDKSIKEILDFILVNNLQEAELILRELIQNYPDEQVREWAQEQLEMHDSKIKIEASSNG
ncbi:MAG: hypothetical protein AAGE59_21495 [Cyanobacteria bacterium P01_F01_bin.86]